MAGLNRRRLCEPLRLFVLCFVVQLAVSAPSREKRDAAPCSNEIGTSKLSYEVGKTYFYGFESEIVTRIEGGSDEDSRLRITGQVALGVLSSCEYILTVLKLSSDKQASGFAPIEKSSIKFTCNNGKFDRDSIVLAKGDPVWSANIKRSLVSLFQNHALEETDVSSLIFRESDVTGYNCLTKYEITGTKFVKTKNLNLCSERDGGIWVSQGVPYSTNKPRIVQSVPAINSDQICTQDFVNGKLQSVKCTETHKLEITNPGGGGAQTIVSTVLTLGDNTAGNPFADSFQGSERSGIAFDHSDDSDKSLEGGVGNVRKILNALCQEVNGGILGPKTSGLFLDLRKQISRTSVRDIRTIYGDLTSGKVCSGAEETQKVKILFEDGAASAGSTSAIEFTAKLYDTLDKRVQELFRVSSAFANGPEESALESVAALLSGGDSKLHLAASGLAHQYCLGTNPDCGSSAAYNSISDAIATQAKANCLNADGIGKAVVALQALGNLDSLSKAAIEAIPLCLRSPDERVIAQALQAFRRDACKNSLKSKARDILADTTVSSDLRIQAYLAIANCLTEDDASFISKVIKGPSNQVYWFVASHRHNWLHTNNQHKVTSKSRHAFKLINVGRVAAKPDARKYSSNFDLSMFDRRENFGASIEANVIYSQESFVPRTISSDLTLDGFGRSYDLLEVGVRLTDYDNLAERIYKSTIQDNYEEDEGADPSLKRRRREVVQPNFQQKDIEVFQHSTKVNTLRKTNGVTDVYARIFGTTICTESLDLDELIKESAEVGVSLVERIKNGLKGSKLEFTYGAPIFTDQVIVPTISGFPLSVDLESTAVVSLKLTADLVEGSSLKSRISPSGSLEIRGRMVVGAGPVEAGLQIELKVHSSRDSNIDVTMVPGKTKGFNCDVKVSFPQDKVLPLEIRSDMYWVTRNGNELPEKTAIKSKLPQNVIADNYCLDTVSTFFGLKYCVNVKLPPCGGGDLPVFPLSGPAVISLSIEKSDPSTNEYLLQLHVDNEENADMHLSLVFDTPGSIKNRKIVLTATGVGEKGSNEKTLDLIIESPWKRLTGTGKYTKVPKENDVTAREVTFDIKADGTTSVLKSKFSGDYRDKTYKPLVSYLDFDLKYGMQSQHSLTINTKYEHQTKEDLLFEGKVASSRLPQLNFDFKWDRTLVKWEKLKLNLAINQGLGADKSTISLNSLTEVNAKGLTTNTNLNVNIPSRKVDFSYNGNAKGDKATQKASGGFELKAVSVLEASSNFNFDGLGGSFDLTTSVSGAGKKLTFKTSGERSVDAEGSKRVYSLNLNVEPKVLDLVSTTTARVTQIGTTTKLNIQTTTTISLVPTPISTTFEVVTAGGAPKKLTGQLNLGNDRVASSSFELIETTGSVSVILEGFVQNRIDGRVELGFGGQSMSNKIEVTYFPLKRKLSFTENTQYSDGKDEKTFKTVAELKFDALNNPKQSSSYAFSSDNSFGVVSSNFNTKNVITVGGKEYQVDLELLPGKQFLNELHSWKFAYRAGDGKKHTVGFQFQADNAEKDKKITVGAQLDLDSVPSVPKDVKLVFGVTELDLKGFYFNKISRLEITAIDKPVQILEVKVSSKKGTNGRFVNAEFRDDIISFYGIDTSIDVGADGVLVDYERSESGKKVAKVVLKVNKGLKGKLSEIKTTAIYDREFSSDGPTFKIEGGYLYRFDSLLDFEVIETYTLSDRRQGAAAVQNIDSSSSLKIAKTSFELKSNQAIKAPDWDEKAEFAVSGGLDGKKFSGSIDIKFTNNSESVQLVKSDVSVNPGFPGDSEFSFSLALPPVVKYNNIFLKVKHDELTKGQSWNNIVTAKFNDIQLEVTSKVGLGAKKSGDFALKLNKDPIRNLVLTYTDSSQGPSVDASIRWGDDSQVISTSGKVSAVGQGFDVTLIFDSALLPNKNWELKIERRIEPTKRSFNVNLGNAASKQSLKFGVEKNTADEASKKYLLTYDTNLSLPALRGLLEGKNGELSININKKAFDIARETAGIQIKFDARLNTITVGFTAKKSDLEGKLSVSGCKDKDCTTGDVELTQGTLSYKATAFIQRKGIKVGFTAENTKSENGKSCDTVSTFYYPLGGSQKELGLRVYSNDGQDSDLELTKKQISAAVSSVRKCGVELTVGARTISVLTAKANWDSDAADADAVEIRVWLDKAREPARALVVSLSNVMAIGEKQGRDLSIVVSHPDFQKDHRLKTSYRFDYAGQALFDITTEIDIFKKTSDTLVFNSNLKQGIAGDSKVFQVGWSAKSESQGLSWDLLCDNIKIEEIDRSATCTFNGKSATRGDRSVKLTYSSDSNSIDAEVVDNDGPVFKINSAPNKSGGITTSFQVPGMKDSWVREVRDNKDPRGIAYRGYGSSYPADKFTETYLGVYDERKLGGGIRSSEGGAVNDLLKYTLEVNRPGPDVILVDWNKELIQKFLDDANLRYDGSSAGIVNFVRKRGNNNAERLQQIVSGFKDALPDPSPFVGRVMGVVNELAQESGGAGQGLIAFASRVKRAAADTKIQIALSAVTESIAKSLEAVANSRRDAINKIKAFFDQMSKWSPTQTSIEGMKGPIKENIKKALTAVRSLNLKAQSFETGFAETVLRKARGFILDAFEDAYDENLKGLNEAFPYHDVEQFLNSLPEYVETAMLKPNETTQEARNDIYEKLDRAIIQIAAKAFSADFQKGSIVSHIPVAKLFGLGKVDNDDDEDDQTYPSFGASNLLFGLISPRKVVPPVEAIGLVLEGTHFQTFDGLLKPFGQACQYLLASDFADNSFTVVVDIQKKYSPTQSIIVTDGTNTVAISGGPDIFVNGKKSEPTKAGPFSVHQDNKWTVIRGTMGLQVSCLRCEEKQICEIQVEGYYHGKLRGVLGLFNNEAYDDKTLPNGKIAEGTENFVNSWKLNQYCRGPNTNLYLQDYKHLSSLVLNKNLNAVRQTTVL